MAKLCLEYQFSRRVGYKWLQRFEEEGWSGLADRRSGPQSRRGSAVGWDCVAELLAVRRKWCWGPKKLHKELQSRHPKAKLPSERTIARLLHQHGCIGLREVRSRPGPELVRPPRCEAQRCNDVWTIDFKGYFHTRDGSRCDALTVRDLHSRYLLVVEHIHEQREAAVRAALTRCFRRYGLPKVMRTDNGSPFGNRGPRGLSSLSVWWLRLGIAVDYMRPAHPQDNGGHEQMHSVLKKRTARPPAATLRGQAVRFGHFRRHYNEERWHEGLEMEKPLETYLPSARAYRAPTPLRYDRTWEQRVVMVGGRITWQGRVRVIGRAFQRELIGLKAKAPSAGGPAASAAVVEVYFGQLLLGELHAHDPGGLRAVRWRKPSHHHTKRK